jgi:hypothetical protein
MLAAIVLGDGALTATRARADDNSDKSDKSVCAAAYEQTQTSRLGGRLSAARTAAEVCARPACPEFIRVDCAKWLTAIDAAQPTVVVSPSDLGARSARDVRIDLDGARWIDGLSEGDASPRPIDPGPHTLRYRLPDGGWIEEIVAIREGERARSLPATFRVLAKPPPGSTPAR